MGGCGVEKGGGSGVVWGEGSGVRHSPNWPKWGHAANLCQGFNAFVFNKVLTSLLLVLNGASGC